MDKRQQQRALRPAPDARAAAALNLASPSAVSALMADLEFEPLKTLGQNFLVDANLVRLIVDAAEIGPRDRTLEIGPGLGVLTEVLAERAERVVAIEKDLRLADWLEARFGGRPNVRIEIADALDADLGGLWAEERLNKVAANLPYSVGNAILVSLLDLRPLPELMVFTLQRDVALRLAAGPRGKEYGLLALWCQADYAVQVLRTVSPTCFLPAPNVVSAIVALRRRPGPDPAPAFRRFFRSLTKRAFSYRRKQMRTILDRVCPSLGLTPAAALEAMAALGLDPTDRPEALSVGQWLELAAHLAVRQD